MLSGNGARGRDLRCARSDGVCCALLLASLSACGTADLAPQRPVAGNPTPRVEAVVRPAISDPTPEPTPSFNRELHHVLAFSDTRGPDTHAGDLPPLPAAAQFRPASSLRPGSAFQPLLDRAVLLTRGTAHCTGYLLDDGATILTAAHCIGEGGVLALIAGRNIATRALRAPGNDDLALLQLETPAPKPAATSVVDQSHTPGKYLLVFGYVGQELQFSAVCRSNAFEIRRMFFDCPTFPGMSGAAIFSVWPNSPNPYRLVAIHSGRLGGAHVATTL